MGSSSGEGASSGLRRHYQTPVYDSERWAGFRPRPGDVVICTPNKCGTTWMQMLCALLIHGTGGFPQPLNRLSRWLERHTEPVEAVLADLDAQPHRRIIKTHTPFDGLPYHRELLYVFCGRDPRDAFLSMMDHMRNLSEESLAESCRRAGMPDGATFPTDPNELFPLWLTVGEIPWMPDGFPFGSVLYHGSSIWPHRCEPNILLLHYADLATDLDSEVTRLADFLGVRIGDAARTALLEKASFEAMQAAADETAPAAHLNEWRSNRDFFRMARMGQWRDVLSLDNQALYDRVTSTRLAPSLRAWFEGGRRVAGPPEAIGCP